jgi:hypothetical protein
VLSLIQNFPSLPKGRPFPRIDESDIVTVLHDRVVDPTKQNQGYAGLCGPAAVDWVALASLRDSDNLVMDLSSVDDELSPGTRSGEVAKWFRDIGYRDVRDDTNYYFCKGRKEIEAIDRDIRFNRDVCLFVNDNMLDDTTARLKSTFVNHWVVLDDAPEIRGDRISLSVYTWGSVQRVPGVGTLSLEEFSRNFYGYVSGMPTFN